MKPATNALLTDLYELTMLRGYFQHGLEQTAVFEFFARKLPVHRNFLVAAGLEQALDFLQGFAFTEPELRWLAKHGFERGFIERLRRMRFTGDVDAMPEGTIFLPEEPILRVIAPLPEAQIVETRLINILNFQSTIASKAARCVLAAPDKLLVDFGLRRAHGAEAGLLSARASYIAGFDATSNVEAGRRFGIPVNGTMAHSFVQAHDDETAAFEHFATSNPDRVVFLLDTYDTEAAAGKVVRLARWLQQRGIRIRGIRLDSGDLAKHARKVRKILDAGGLRETRIFASGNLDEFALQKIARSGAPIDGFGVGTRMNTSADAPYIDCAYKLQEYDGRPRRKRSEGKATWPGRKQVFRRFNESGRMESDILTLEKDPHAGTPLIVPVMRKGKRLDPAPSLESIREHATSQLRLLADRLRRIDRASPYPVKISKALCDAARRLEVT
jgi:nicotinate phosphoribosyltransferase